MSARRLPLRSAARARGITQEGGDGIMSGKTRQPKVVSIHAHRKAAPAVSTCMGHIVAWSEEKGLLVDYAGSPHGPYAAQSTVALGSSEIAALIGSRRPVLLAFERNEPDRPIVMGIVQPLGRAEETGPKSRVEAVVDGEEVVLEGKERVELRCGKASIVLTKAGKILVNGTYISSHSTGVHRIRGGHVEVN